MAHMREHSIHGKWGGHSFLPAAMNLTDPFQPRPSEIHLMFSCDPAGSLKDLRRGIRAFLTIFYPAGVAWRMAMAPSYNYVTSRDGSRRTIMLTADGSTAVASMLLDLYGRLLNAQSLVTTPRNTYMVSLDGTLDLQRVHAISSHYMWVSEFFRQNINTAASERHLLN